MYDYNDVKKNIEDILKENVKNNPVAFIMVGIPASGKSTLIEKIKNDFNISDNNILSIDMLAEKYAEEHNLTYKSVIITNFKQFKKEMQDKANYIKENKEDFIWDQVNSNKNIREAKVSMYKNSFHTIGIVMNPTTEEILTRMIERKINSNKDLSSAMIAEIARSFSMPEISEGFKDIIVVGKEVCRLSKNPQFKMNELDLSKEALDNMLIEKGLHETYYRIYKENREINVIMKDKAIKLKK